MSLFVILKDVHCSSIHIVEFIRKLRCGSRRRGREMTENTALLSRVERIESHLAIQQLPIRYALAVDSRDLDAWVQLFVEDVDCGSHGVGREALKRFIDPSVRKFYRFQHL